MTTSTHSVQIDARAARIPSQRDFEIFRMAEILGLTHDRIASVHRLTRRRVSQIVEIVRDWLSNNPCEDPQLATELQRKRLAQHLQRMRLEDCLERARAALELAPTHLTTTTIKADGSETKTLRQQPPIDVQVLKTYLRTIQALGKFHEQPEVPYPPPAEGEFTWAKEAMNEVLARWYERIWSSTLKIDHFYDFAEELIGAFIKALRLQQPAAETTPRPDRQDDGHQDDDQRHDEAPVEEGEAPAEPTQARSASDLPGCDEIVHSASSSTSDLGPWTWDTPPTADPVGCVESASADATHESAMASLRTEYSVRSTSASPQEADDPNPKSKIQIPNSAIDPPPSDASCIPHPSSFPSASPTSQREVPHSEPPILGPDAATSCPAETFIPGTVPKTEPSTEPTSQENQNREVPPPSVAPALPPSLSSSLCPSIPLAPTPDP